MVNIRVFFTQAGLPIEIVALTAGINILVDMIFTFGNVVANLVGAKIVDQTEKHKVATIEKTQVVSP